MNKLLILTALASGLMAQPALATPYQVPANAWVAHNGQFLINMDTTGNRTSLPVGVWKNCSHIRPTSPARCEFVNANGDVLGMTIPNGPENGSFNYEQLVDHFVDLPDNVGEWKTRLVPGGEVELSEVMTRRMETPDGEGYNTHDGRLAQRPMEEYRYVTVVGVPDNTSEASANGYSFIRTGYEVTRQSDALSPGLFAADFHSYMDYKYDYEVHITLRVENNEIVREEADPVKVIGNMDNVKDTFYFINGVAVEFDDIENTIAQLRTTLLQQAKAAATRDLEKDIESDLETSTELVGNFNGIAVHLRPSIGAVGFGKEIELESNLSIKPRFDILGMDQDYNGISVQMDYSYTYKGELADISLGGNTGEHFKFTQGEYDGFKYLRGNGKTKENLFLELKAPEKGLYGRADSNGKVSMGVTLKF